MYGSSGSISGWTAGSIRGESSTTTARFQASRRRISTSGPPNGSGCPLPGASWPRTPVGYRSGTESRRRHDRRRRLDDGPRDGSQIEARRGHHLRRSARLEHDSTGICSFNIRKHSSLRKNVVATGKCCRVRFCKYCSLRINRVKTRSRQQKTGPSRTDGRRMPYETGTAGIKEREAARIVLKNAYTMKTVGRNAAACSKLRSSGKDSKANGYKLSS